MDRITTKTFKSLEDLKRNIVMRIPSLYFASQTSTVIPYEKIEAHLAESLNRQNPTQMANLSQLPTKIAMKDNQELFIQGPITWKEAKAYCLGKAREIMTSPTEELAAVLSGIATSATGERCFGYGVFRDHLVKVGYIDSSGEQIQLDGKKQLKDHPFFRDSSAQKLLYEYQQQYEKYQKFKNGPFPRLEAETDLMTGTEGQLGVITDAHIKTTDVHNIMYIFVNLPKWETNYLPHLELFEGVQAFRDKIFSCELIDENSLSYLPKDERPVEGMDLIYLEINQKYFDFIYEQLLTKLTHINEENFYEVSVTKCRELRMNVPRYIFETNTRMGVTKKGTDVQVRPDQFKKLMNLYQTWSHHNIKYNLFGHFGDAHLHFNFMPTVDEVDICQQYLHDLYTEVLKWEGSPFAEHGIGLLKKDFIAPFYSDVQLKMFRFLKNQMDPNNIFFPQGFMNV